MKLSHKPNPFELKTIDFFLNIFFIEMFAVALSVLLMETYLNTAKMRNNIIQSEKLNVVSQLAASVAHEVRNPLTVVRGFLQLIGQSPTNEKNADFIKTAITELDRAEEIIGDYLNLAKPQLEKIEVMNTLEELQKIADLMASYASMRGVGLLLSCDNPSLYISGEKAKFAQGMINIIKNSIEATSSVGGVVKMEAFREARHVIIKVIDYGHGMAKEELKRLGTPFYSTKSKGTGLGLMVTFQIIRAMEGKIEYSSEKNAGTTVTITLPAR
ncbi:sensor histidine kinase [Paenibacillus thermotolerans]|uniref:sensor histidine kinase n=1 Tax=Paenibacillus thermotolerans TaxID=3027807 RepID=UPI0023682B4D|nr:MULTISPECIES: HAMP domain-containing sensor histidine kinase [unclassified Paenibacillus]